ncbi:MAG: glycoside hydrolase family 16 protein [Bacilli bacterium]|nr:glycoside hydrolase family 16 protein [Bacilli bacterium]MDD4053822.1 glycoside hydrolase family 16 protein [Bacilli bacterium]
MNKKRIMKYTFFILLIVFFCLITKTPYQKVYKINVIEEENNNILVDDFNGKLNTRFWNAVEQGESYNNDLQYYNPKNISIIDGLLELVAKKENFKDHNYTSGMITTKGKFEFLYGKIIFKIRPAVGNGLLSAAWLLPADDSLFPEVDMMEVLGNKGEDEIWTGIHYKDLDGSSRKKFTNIKNENDFAIYEIEWNEKEIKGYINNKLIYKSEVGIPNKKMYLILNLAVGGN